VPKRLAEALVVVIARQRQDGAAAGQEWAEHFLQMANCVAQPVGAGQLAKQVAGHEQHVGQLLLAVRADPLDRAAQVVGAVDPAQAVAQVPVGGVQDFHSTSLS
jgi:hypothetical protein